MKNLLIICALFFPFVANAKPVKTVPTEIIHQAKYELIPAFCNAGKTGAEKVVSNCYLNNIKGQGLARCMLEDSALIIFDNQMNDIIKAHTGKDIGESEGFLSDSAISSREKLYFLPNFGTMKKAMLYFDEGNKEIVSAMGNCIEKK